MQHTRHGLPSGSAPPAWGLTARAARTTLRTSTPAGGKSNASQDLAGCGPCGDVFPLVPCTARGGSGRLEHLPGISDQRRRNGHRCRRPRKRHVVGASRAAWGLPIRAYTGGSDAFVAKVAADGSLRWLTFLGSAAFDSGESISVDDSGAVYVAGVSYATWGGPIAPFSGQADAFVAKLDSFGTLEWNTFLGSNEWDGALGVSAGAGGVLVTGLSSMGWGTPVRLFQGDYDAFVARLGPDGALDWNTFLGGGGLDRGKDVTFDERSGYVYVTGEGNASWGSPVRPFVGMNNDDAFAAQLTDCGVLQWNTFLGGTSLDSGWGIAVDSDGALLVTGMSGASWGTPVRPFGGLEDAYVAKIDSWGSLQWHTFLGSPGGDAGYDVAAEGGDVYATGLSHATWGMPLIPFAPFALTNAFVAGTDRRRRH